MSDKTFTRIDKIDIDSSVGELLKEYNISNLFTSINESNRIFISGSTALNIAKNKKSYISSDLDLYIYSNRLNRKWFIALTITLFNAGYRTKAHLNTLLIESEINEIARREFYLHNNIIEEGSDYNPLNEHIISIKKLNNSIINKNIDIIVLKPSCESTIESLLNDSFDYDIVKNFIYYDSFVNKFHLMSKLPDIETCDTATISISHFNNKISKSLYAFNSFKCRYIKYGIDRKYIIKIGELEITKLVFIQILNGSLPHIKFKYKNIDEPTNITFNNNITTDTIKNVFKLSNGESHIYFIDIYQYKNLLDFSKTSEMFNDSGIDKKIKESCINAIHRIHDYNEFIISLVKLSIKSK